MEICNIKNQPDESSAYDVKFYENQKEGSCASAKKVAPFILALFQNIHSVVDFGCGVGCWLKMFDNGKRKIKGFDFGSGVPVNLIINPESYENINLANPIDINEKFDLCISLEVGEHIEAKYCEAFIDNLTNAADIILFSAAIPGQPGRRHVNTQWPAWWARRFNSRGFIPFDILRPYFWLDKDICWWYRQNMILYLNLNQEKYYKKLQKFSNFNCLPIVHPDMMKLYSGN